MKIALDPTPFHHSHSLLEFPQLVADLVFAEDDSAREVSRYQLNTIKEYVSSVQ